MSRLAPLLLLLACSEASQGATDAPRDDATDTTTAPTQPCPAALEGRTRCAAGGLLESCLRGLWQPDTCPGTTVCDEGACLPAVCTPEATRCLDARTRERCSPLGTRWHPEPCEAGLCVDGACVPGCTPGARRCDGLTVLVCGDDLVEVAEHTCEGAAGELCVDGRCLTECEVRGAKRGYLACDFWAADLPNDESALDNVFAFAFSNASPRSATVTITYPFGPVETLVIPEGALATHALPVPRTLSQITAPGLGRFGFHIVSDQPIAAFMFNPLERYDTDAAHTVATNDASLLIPTTALGHDHLAITWSDPAEFSRPPFVTVVATADDTEISVTPSEPILIAQSPFVIPVGRATTFVLDAHETLNLEPSGTSPSDLTGTRVTSNDHPIAVFSGNRCARVPDEGRFCDHVETQLPPLETWGDRFVVTKFTDRGGEADYFKVLAQADGTELVFDPPRSGAPVLAAGQSWQFSAREDFTLVASRPILVAHFMASQSTTTPPGPFGISGDCPLEFGGNCQGDPALVLAAPIAQWRTERIFLVPDTYRHRFIDVAFAAGTRLQLDGAPLDTAAARTVGASDWRALTVPTTGGFHALVSDAPVGLVVYGFDHNISYAYDGGLDFRNLRAEAPEEER